MAFTSYDGILSALAAGNGQDVIYGKTFPITTAAGVYYSSWLFSGQTPAGALSGSAGTVASTMVACTNNTVGAIPVVSPTTASGTNPYMLSVSAMPTGALLGTAILIDRLADTGVLTTASGATCTITMPAGGWPRYTDGIGVMAFMESQNAAPTATAVVNMSYTNTDSTAGRVPSPVTLTAVAYKVFGSGANAPTGSPFFALQGTDKGIKSIENVSLTVAAAANVALVVCKPLLMVPVINADYVVERDLVNQTPRLPKLPVSSLVSDTTACLQWIYLPNAVVATPSVIGSIVTVTG